MDLTNLNALQIGHIWKTRHKIIILTTVFRFGQSCLESNHPDDLILIKLVKSIGGGLLSLSFPFPTWNTCEPDRIEKRH